MTTPHRDQTVTTNQQENEVDATTRLRLESISIPVGTFAGTEDRIIRIRNGQIVPADTGDQVGGQN